MRQWKTEISEETKEFFSVKVTLKNTTEKAME